MFKSRKLFIDARGFGGGWGADVSVWISEVSLRRLVKWPRLMNRPVSFLPLN